MQSNLFKTKDMFHASLLHAKGLKLISVEWIGSVAYWTFDDTKGRADLLVHAFVNGDLKGSIKDFVESMKTMKQMLYRR